jgi:hypothetical protein
MRTLVKHADSSGVEEVRGGKSNIIGILTTRPHSHGTRYGFGDVINPRPTEVEHPTLLNFLRR